MDCFCCRENVAQGRHVKLRGYVRKGFQIAHLDEAAYIAYQEAATLRSSFVCEGCYGVLDSSDGTGPSREAPTALLGHPVGTRPLSTRRRNMRRIACARLGSMVWWMDRLWPRGWFWNRTGSRERKQFQTSQAQYNRLLGSI